MYLIKNFNYFNNSKSLEKEVFVNFVKKENFRVKYTIKSQFVYWYCVKRPN